MTKTLVHPLGAGEARTVLSTSEHRQRNGGKGDHRWFHAHGVDLMCPKDQPRMPVYAVEDGIVGAKDGNPGNAKAHEFQHSDDPGTAGWRLYLFASDGVETYMYQHLEKLADGLKPGCKVTAGQLLGYTGAPASGGPHLHFALKNGDTDAFIANVPHSGIADLSAGAPGPECAAPEVTECAPNPDIQTVELATSQPLMFSALDAVMTPWDPGWAQADNIPDAAMSIHDPSQIQTDHTASDVPASFPDLASMIPSELLPDLSSPAGHHLDHSQGLTDAGALDGSQDAGSPNHPDWLTGTGGGHDGATVPDHGTNEPAARPDPPSGEN